MCPSSWGAINHRRPISDFCHFSTTWQWPLTTWLLALQALHTPTTESNGFECRAPSSIMGCNSNYSEDAGVLSLSGCVRMVSSDSQSTTDSVHPTEAWSSMGLAPFLRQSHAKLHSPIPVPQLRCPSDIQVLRPEASSSSPDLLLDIFIILIWPVCLFALPSLGYNHHIILCSYRRVSQTYRIPSAVSRPSHFVSISCHIQSRNRHI